MDRIAVDARYLKREGIGISRYIDLAIRELADLDAETILLTDDPGHARTLIQRYPRVRAISLSSRSGFLWEQLRLRKHLRQAGYSAYIAPANYGIPLARAGHTRLMVVIHDLIPLRLPHLYLARKPLWAVKYLISLMIVAIRADSLVAVSHSTADDIRRLLYRRDPRVAYPIIPERASPCPATEQARTCAHDPTRLGDYILYNGGSDVRKNVPVLIRAFAGLRREAADIDLVILGDGYGSFAKLIEACGVSDHVHLLGYVDESTKSAIVAHALTMIYPSRLEGFGLPILEALQAGLPVVTGTKGALREIAGDAGIYVEPINEHTLKDAILFAITPTARAEAKARSLDQLDRLRNRQLRESFTAAVTHMLSGDLHATASPARRHYANHHAFARASRRPVRKAVTSCHSGFLKL